MTSRANEAKIACKLQGFLGDDYEIKYDACDSGMTFCYYKGQLYKQVANSEMRGSLNVGDYTFAANMQR